MLIEAYRWFFLRLADVVGIGWGIFALSVITSAAMMPLMRAVAGVVKRETEYQSVILPQLAEIKKRFSSDAERHLHIQRLYARYGYSPLSAVKKVLPLFVQIPFLLLTYYMLKNTPQLSGVSFLFLDDLGQPDALLKTVGKFPLGLNVLPIVMTLVNMLTVAATPGFTHKDQVQAVGISLLFLVLLYTAPSALLLYWTLNNVITMIRTLAAKRGEGARLLGVRMLAFVSLFSPRSLYVRAFGMPLTVWAWITLLCFVISVYFCIVAKLLSNVGGGSNFSIMYKGMVFVVSATSVSSLMLLRHESRLCRVALFLSIVLCVGFSVAFASLYVLSYVNFMRIFEWADLYAITSVLLLVYLCPYIMRWDRWFDGYVSDFGRALCRQWYLLLLPMILAVHYSYSSDVFILSVSSALCLVLLMVFPCVVLFALLLLQFRSWVAAESLFKVAVGILVAVYIMPLVSTESGILSYNQNLPIRLLAMVLVPLWVLRVRKRAPMFIFMCIFLVFVVGDVICRHDDDREDRVSDLEHEISADARWHGVLGDVACIKSNNVYLLVYDSYGHRSIMENLGIEDGEIYKVLEKNGFTIYDAYSLGSGTLSSMSAAFTLGGIGGCSISATIAGDNVFSDFIRAHGYRTSYLLNGYEMPNRGERMPGQYYYPSETDIPRPEMVLFPCIVRGTFSQSPQVFNSYTHEDWMCAYYDVMRNRLSSRCFVYAHNPYPAHVSWLPRFRKSDKEEQMLYKQRVKVAQLEIRETLKLLADDRDSICIICSDHGGFLMTPGRPGEYDVRNLIDHYGILLAIRWPTDYRPCLKLNCLQNVFLEVLIYLTGDRSLSRLENPGVTVRLDYPIDAPAGVVRNGVIQSGPDKGRNLFEAARAMLK